MTEECKKEIEQYVQSKGWNNRVLFKDNKLIGSYFYYSKKGIKRKLGNKWEKDPENMDKYLLEYIDHILRKHNIIKIIINESTIDDIKVNTYSSKDWKINNIELKI